MRFIASTLPWCDHSVSSTGNLRDFFAKRLPATLHYHLPSSVTVYSDERVSAGAVTSFVEGAAQWLAQELPHRERRLSRFVELGLLETNELRSALTPKHAQPWIIYYSETGGLKVSLSTGNSSGVVPCSSMPNHAVAWQTRQDGRINVWLVTDRKAGHDWDWESDIGHESAHAAFAPVPLFSQSFAQELSSIQFTTARRASDLSMKQLARMCYLYTELSVVAVRGETRATETRLPLVETDQLSKLLLLSDEILPGLGFDQALVACDRVHGIIDLNTGSEIFEIGAPALRAMARIVDFVGEPDISRVAHYIFGGRFSSPQRETCSNLPA